MNAFFLYFSLRMGTQGTQVFVGGLTYRVRERDLEKFFRKYGRINAVAMKNGFAFVVSLVTLWFLFYSMVGTRVYVGGLPFGTRERDLQKFFKGYGRFHDVLIKNHYGFVVSIQKSHAGLFFWKPEKSRLRTTSFIFHLCFSTWCH